MELLWGRKQSAGAGKMKRTANRQIVVSTTLLFTHEQTAQYNRFLLLGNQCLMVTWLKGTASMMLVDACPIRR